MPTVFTKVIGSLKNILKYQTEAFRQYFSSLTNRQYCLCCFPTHPHSIKNQAFRQIHIATKTSTKRKNITRRIYTSAVGYLKRKHFYFFICFSSLLHIRPHHIITSKLATHAVKKTRGNLPKHKERKCYNMT
mmetsp:Transcript_36116/g.53869  ORF Transcript_36116/g.53869 Transcript_36116/m.53869 type:complete len:132 (-) Transcript_36116:1453-1848(-)